MCACVVTLGVNTRRQRQAVDVFANNSRISLPKFLRFYFKLFCFPSFIPLHSHPIFLLLQRLNSKNFVFRLIPDISTNRSDSVVRWRVALSKSFSSVYFENSN